MSIIHPTKVHDFKVTEGSLDAEWISVLDGNGNEQKLFKVNPQASKVVSLNKAGLITPDTGYSYMESVTVTNTAPVGEDKIGVILSNSSDGGIAEDTFLLRFYSHNVIFVKDGVVANTLVIGETYQNALYPTDSWKVHPASWAVGRVTEVDNKNITDNGTTCLEKNNSGRVSFYLPYQGSGNIPVNAVPYTYKSFEA